jgi:hypothetical protein
MIAPLLNLQIDHFSRHLGGLMVSKPSTTVNLASDTLDEGFSIAAL